MSVINQMLKDLDARGQGEGAARAAALAAAGQGRAAHARVPSGWDRLPLVALGLMAVMLAAVAWWAWPARDLGAREAAIEAAGGGVAEDTVAKAEAEAETANVSPMAAPERTPSSSTADEAPRAEAPVPIGTPAPVEVVDRASATKAATPEPQLRAERRAPPTPTTAPAPVARSTIEVLETPPLDRWAEVRDVLASGDAEAALRRLDAAAAPEAQEAEALALRATAFQQLSRHEAAIEAWTRALRRSPDIGAWWGGLGLSLDALGRSDEALAAYREAQRRGPLDPALADYLDGRVEALSAADPAR